MKVLVIIQERPSRVDGLVAEGEPDLVYARATFVGELGEGAAQVMRGEGSQALF